MKQTLTQFIKYVIVGGIGVFLDIGTLILFSEVFGIIPWVSVVLNQVIVLSFNFTLNKYWSFQNKQMVHQQVFRYITLASTNYVLSVVAMYVCNEVLGYQYVVVRLVTLAVMVAWNFLVYKYWVFNQASESS